MERPIFKPVGTRAEDLDPSSLVVDAGVLEKNVETVHSFFASSEAKLRPHMNAHLCPALAHRQMVAGGTVGGIGVSTIGQAEAFAGSGLNDIFVTNVVATAPKIARLCALAQRAHMTVAVDDAGVVGSLSEAAVANGVALDVVVDVTGNAAVRETAYNATSNTGKTVLAGVPHHQERITIDSFPLHFGRKIFGSHGGETRPDVDIPRYLQLYKLGKLKLDEQITHRFTLDDINQAVDVVRNGEAGRCVISIK